MLNILQKTLGWRNWAVFSYNSFIENIFVVFYIALVTRNYSNAFLINLLLFYIFSVFSTSFGYLINDLADRELDRKHNKSNTFENTNERVAISVVIAVFVLSAMPAINFISNRYFAFLWILWTLAAVFYSVKPVRLKERGKTGLIVVVFAQRVLPVLLVFAAFRFNNLTDIMLITFYILMRGLSSDVNHQIEDFNSDLKTSTGTFAVTAGLERIRRVFHLILEVEKLLLAAVLLLFVLRFQDYPAGYSVNTGILAIIYLIILIISYFRIRGGADRNPFRIHEKNIFQFLHHAYPSVILPLALIIIIIPNNMLFALVLLAFLFNKKMLSLKTYINSYPLLFLKKMRQ
ncbi:MAG: UbiA family prenyltransferase [Calditrichaceae bacterium]